MTGERRHVPPSAVRDRREDASRRVPRRNRMLVAGRVLLSFALIGWGALGLLYGDFVNSLQPVPAWMPAYGVLAILNGLLLIAVGVTLTLDRRTDVAAAAVAAFFASWIVLLHVPSAFTDPALLRSPWWIRTFETLALIGGAVTLAGLNRRPVRGSWIRHGRIAFGVSLPVFGVLHLVYPESVAGLVPPWYPWPMFWAYFTGLAQILGGAAIAIGILPRLAATLAGVMYGTWALTLHIPRSWCRLFGPCELLDVPAVGLMDSRAGLTSLFVAVAMCGAAWIVAGAVTDRDETRTGDRRDEPDRKAARVR